MRKGSSKLALVLLWATLLPAMAAAEDRTAALREVFGRIPQAVLTIENGSGTHISFHSPEAARTVGRGFEDHRIGPGVAALGLTGPGPLVQHLLVEEDAGWPSRIGFAPSNLRYLASIDAHPSAAYVMALTPAAGEGARATLLSNGYEMSGDGLGPPFLRRGADDFAMDLAARDVADPFGGHLGLASRVGIIGDLLFYSTATPMLRALLDPEGPSLMDHPDIRQLVDAIDAAPLGAGQVMQAVILSDPLIFGLPQTVGGLRPQSHDVPVLGPWLVGMLVEVSDGTTDTALFILSFVGEEPAAVAAAELPVTLANYVSLRTMRPLLQDYASVPTVGLSTSDPRVLLVSFSSPYDNSRTELIQATNFRRMQQLIYAGDAGFLRPN